MSSERAREPAAGSAGSRPPSGAGELAISVEQLVLVQRILHEHIPTLEVRAFGSRAGGSPKQFSDLDLLIVTIQPLETRRLALLAEAFAESDLPFKVDVLDGSTTEPGFRARLLPRSIVVQPPHSAAPR
jgi:predicted nucleotidyltransferase